MIRKTITAICVTFRLFTNCTIAHKMDLNKLVDVVAWNKNEKMDYKIGFIKDGRFFYQIIQKDSVQDIKTDYKGIFRIKKDTIFLIYNGMPPPPNFTSYLIMSPETFFIQPFTNSTKLLFLRLNIPRDQFKHF